MAHTPRRRTRGPNKPKPPVEVAVATTNTGEQNGAAVAVAQVESASEDAPRRRRKKLGAASLRLSAPARPGYTRRFFNDDANRIAQAHELGYDIVSGTKAQTPGLGSHDSRLVGTKATGEPLRAILMETPNELYAEGLAEKEAHAAAIDQAIMSGRDSEGQLSQIPQDERYGQVSMKRDG